MTGEMLWAQLRGTVLRAADLGDEFEESVQDKEPIAMNLDGIMHIIRRQMADEVIIVDINPASHGSPRQWAGAQTFWAWNPATTDTEIWEEAPPPLGMESVAFRWRSEVQGQTRGGHLVAWRYGDLVVSISVQGAGESSALSYAQRQQEKLRMAFPTAPSLDVGNDEVAPVVKIECPETHPIKGVRLEDGTQFYLLVMDAAYDDATPERCFRSDAAARRAGYARRVDEPSRW
jgi:hypothetical protein